MIHNAFTGMQNPLKSSFIFGAGTDAPDAESLRKRREIADALAQSSVTGSPQNVGEGVAAVGKALLAKWADKRLDPLEKAEKERVGGELQSIIASLGGGVSPVLSGREAPRGTGFVPGSDTSQFALPQTNPSAARTPAPNMAFPPSGDMASKLRQSMIDRGLPEHVADGFLMNFQDESGLNPGINEQAPTVPGSRGGYGLYQLTGPRRQAYEQWAGQSGRDLADPEAQLDFMMSELAGSEKDAAQAIMSTRSPGEAAAAIAERFLRPAPENLERRVASYTGGGGAPSGGVDPALLGELSTMLENPYLPEGQRAVVQALMGQAVQGMQPPDPMRAIEMERAQLELEQMRNPQADPMDALRMQKLQMEIQQMGQPEEAEPGYTPVTPEEAAALGLPAGGAFQKGPDGRISQIGGAGTNVTVNNSEGGAPDQPFYEELGKKDAGNIATILETAPQVGRVGAQIAQLEQTLANVPTGGAAALKAAAGEYGIQTEGLDDIQAAQALINSMVPGQRPPGSGPMSDADLALFKQSLPRLINSPEGNRQIIGTMRAINDYDQQIVGIATRVANGEMTPAQGRTAMSEVANPLANFSPPADPAAPAAVQASPAAPRMSRALLDTDPADWTDEQWAEYDKFVAGKPR